MYFLLLGLCCWFLAASIQDAHVSEKGFRLGYVEGSDIANKMFGLRPTFLQLMFYNVLVAGAFASPSYFLHTTGWAAATLFALALKHERSIRKWHRVFATGGASLKEPQTVWQKFIGS